jgi:hypothetical protein
MRDTLTPLTGVDEAMLVWHPEHLSHAERVALERVAIVHGVTWDDAGAMWLTAEPSDMLGHVRAVVDDVRDVLGPQAQTFVQWFT